MFLLCTDHQPSKIEQDWQCTYHVTLRRICVPTVGVEEQVFNIMSVCLYSCVSYPACKPRAPYYMVTCGLSSSTIFSTFSHKRSDFSRKKKLLNIQRDLIFSTSFVWNFSHAKKNCERYYRNYKNGLPKMTFLLLMVCQLSRAAKVAITYVTRKGFICKKKQTN